MKEWKLATSNLIIGIILGIMSEMEGKIRYLVAFLGIIAFTYINSSQNHAKPSEDKE